MADPGFTGILKKKLDPRTGQTVTGFILLDWGNQSAEEIRKMLSGKIFPSPRSRKDPGSNEAEAGVIKMGETGAILLGGQGRAPACRMKEKGIRWE